MQTATWFDLRSTAEVLIFNTHFTLHNCVKICYCLHTTNKINTVLIYMRLKDTVIKYVLVISCG